MSITLKVINITSISTSYSDVYIHNSMFRDFTYNGYGGAISCTSTRLLIEDSSFISCTTSSLRGGAIYYTSTSSGKVLLNRICAYSCYSTYTTTSTNPSKGQCFYIN